MTKEKGVLQENKAKREKMAMKASKGTWERKETEDCQAPWVNLENLDLKVQKEVKDLEVKREPWGHLAIRERLVLQAFLDIPEVLVRRVTKDNKEAMVYLVPKERGGEMEPSENVAKLDLE